MTIKTPSAEQIAIFNAIAETSSNLIIEAAAGSGKTSTIIHAMRECIGGASAIYIVFNKRNQLEAQERLQGTSVAAMTLNALGHRALASAFKRGVRLDANKIWTIIRDERIMAKSSSKTYGATIKKMVDLARADGIGLLCADDIDAWISLCERHEIETPAQGSLMLMIDLARKTLAECIRLTHAGLIDFADQCYSCLDGSLAVRWPRGANIFVDEAQDLNATQAAMVAAMVAAGNSRVIFVGDPWQAIYGFRGAQNDSMSLLKEQFSCQTLPLSICWRCDASMIKLAQSTGAPIQVAPGKEEGICVDVDSYQTQPGDVVLCRTSAPLLRGCYKLIAQGISATVLGRDLGKGLIALIKKLRPRDTSDLTAKLDRWLADEIAAAEESGRESKAAIASDKVDCIGAILDLSVSRSIEDLCSAIDSLFSDDAERGAVVFSTIHKAKGLEWDRVILLDRQQMPLKWAKSEDAIKQETNCAYVAYTRARHELIMVTSEGLNRRDPSDNGASMEPAMF
jgi:DNA helicase-2/ATP-dependent DNA helicase PcrA